MDNIITNAQFRLDETGFPTGWKTNQPTESLKPVFKAENGWAGISGGGKPHCFGYWYQYITVTEGQSYAFEVKLQTEGIEDLHLSLLNLICWQRSGQIGLDCAHDHISHYHREGDVVTGKGTFTAPRGVNRAQIQLGLRYSAQGHCRWLDVRLTPAQPPARRYANVGAVKFNPFRSATLEDNLSTIQGYLHKAGSLECDLVLLPEFTSWYHFSPSNCLASGVAENLPDGPTCRLLSRFAREYSMYVCGGVIEQEDGLTYNTSVIFGRSGEYVGKYRKTQLYWQESIFYGLTPGDDFPVFELDFGKVGITICYENWFGDVSRLLALKGAELILLPNENYEKCTIPARAIETMTHYMVSSIKGPTLIATPKGEIISEIDTEGIICSRIEISNRIPPHVNSGGTFNTASGGRRSVKNTISNRMYDETYREKTASEERSEDFDWIKREA